MSDSGDVYGRERAGRTGLEREHDLDRADFADAHVELPDDDVTIEDVIPSGWSAEVLAQLRRIADALDSLATRS